MPVLCASVGTVAQMDWTVLHAVNGGVASRDWLEDALTRAAAALVPAYALATLALWVVGRGASRARARLACASALGAALVAMAANQIISHLWERPRPYVTHHAVQLLSAPSADPSFPSDHAAAAFAIAFAILASWRRVGVAFLVVASLIGVARVALGMHYPSDVVAGAAVGWLAALLVTRRAQRPLAAVVALAGRITDPVIDRAAHRVLSGTRG